MFSCWFHDEVSACIVDQWFHNSNHDNTSVHCSCAHQHPERSHDTY